MAEMKERLEKAFKEVNELLEICGVASISIGVLHEGNTLFTRSVGLRNVEEDLPATPETTYLLASCSKSFLSAATGILVNEGKVAWNDPVSKHVPGFDPVGDPQIGAKATIRDALRHTTGLSRPQIFLLGPNCSIVAKEEDYVGLVNCAPTENDAGQRFNSWWWYNNLPYGLTSLALQNAAGKRYSDLLRERIIKPLGMNNTAVSAADLSANPDRAHGYAKLGNGDYVRLNTGDAYTTENHAPVLGFIGVQSSVVDLLKFSAASMDAFAQEQDGIETTVQANPLKEMSTIWNVQWTRPTEDGFDNQLAFALGWYRGYLPTSGLGYVGMNYRVKDQDTAEYDRRYILGRDSPRRFFVGHQGNANGYASAMYLAPESKSAVVALSNGQNLGDAADFAAKIMLQALFDTKPHVDHLELARKEAALHRHWYEDVLVDWLAHSDVVHKERPLSDYVGDYHGYNTTVSIFEREETGHLALTINGHTESMCDLELYAQDQYSFLPRTRDVWLKNGMMDYEHYFVGVLRFRRDSSGTIEGLKWEYEPEDVAWFSKVQGEKAKGSLLMRSVGSILA
ncbi:penicillin-binding [Fusarium albosuccineum]|uniref:Penicillin-binding n=1 Tax=Fusarium albosuccineum TaxID=1237068 RepID=A0A8H4L210_9HYPO|nr:penicillin-binding [Fusarium albosuccineum]